MKPTKNDLPGKVRTKVLATLGDRLADATDLMLQSKQAHWNVKGPTSSLSTSCSTRSTSRPKSGWT